MLNGLYNIVKLLNESDKTGLERIVDLVSIDNYKRDYTIRHYIDNNGFNRFVLTNSYSIPISAILLDNNNICLYRETLSEYKNKGYNKNLWLYALSVLGSIYHSDNLTIEGKRLIK
jgi:hypothetical protein